MRDHAGPSAKPAKKQRRDAPANAHCGSHRPLAMPRRLNQMPGGVKTMTDPYDLQRFVEAQAPVYEQVRAELAAGAKASHWMWFVFPQLRALGRSATAHRFGLASIGEAGAYWQHSVLGPRLAECSQLVLRVEGRTAWQIFRSPDDQKLRSCMTLFAQVAPQEPVFGQVLEKYFDGVPDARTLELL
ncbi:MAG: DUF1810 domain-containing protein [Variovorax sp.]